MQGIVQMACDARMLDSEYKYRAVQTMSRHLQDEFNGGAGGGRGQGEHTKEPDRRGGSSHRRKNRMLGRSCGSYITVLYVAVKLMYAANVVLQFILLNHFLGTKNLLYGFRILSDLLREVRWEQTGVFPRVTLCDFEVSSKKNVEGIKFEARKRIICKQ